ncbi:putative monocarboxylate permease [Clohesyomyces aquaticus]|uniref:Putative monocarboxylate permease n=1 Tax=Clohesyomyces aquaticus TaxID=1231657 RepID=A0A1Y1YXG0_9PLEO|nr:putative monocarboxylate permease [Clohesyomyces aquaticus]
MSFKIFSVGQEEPGPPSDGGVRAWLKILAGHLINALTWGYSASFGIYQLHYTTTLSLPESQIAWIGPLQVFFTFFIGTFFAFLTNLATECWQIILAQVLCTGLGMGALYMPAVTVINSYWKERKAMALGLAASGSGTGSILFPLVVQHLQPTIRFPRAVQVQGYIALAFAIAINLLLRPRLPWRKAGPLAEWKAFLEPRYTLFMIGVFLIFWALYFCFFFTNTYATSIVGLSPEEAVNLLVAINAVGIPVRPLLGLVADRYFGSLSTLIVSTAFLAIMLFVWMPIRSVSSLYLFSVFYGLASLTTDPSKLGVRFGVVCSTLAFASLVGPPTAGALIQSDNGGFLKAHIYAGTVTISAAPFVCAAKWNL